MLGPRFWHRRGSWSVGRRIAKYVEANPSTIPLVSRRQSAPIASLLAILVFANQGAHGRNSDSSLRYERSTPPRLKRILNTLEQDGKGKPSPGAAGLE